MFPNCLNTQPHDTTSCCLEFPSQLPIRGAMKRDCNPGNKPQGWSCPSQRTSLLKEAVPGCGCVYTPWSALYVDCAPSTSGYWAYDRRPRILVRFPVSLMEMLALVAPGISCPPQHPILANLSLSRSLPWVLAHPKSALGGLPKGSCGQILSYHNHRILLNAEKLISSPPRSGPREGCPFPLIVFNTLLEVLINVMRQWMGNRLGSKKKKKTSLSADDMTVYVENPKKVTKNPIWNWEAITARLQNTKLTNKSQLLSYTPAINYWHLQL